MPPRSSVGRRRRNLADDGAQKRVRADDDGGTLLDDSEAGIDEEEALDASSLEDDDGDGDDDAYVPQSRQGGPQQTGRPADDDGEVVDIEQDDFTRLINAFTSEPMPDNASGEWQTPGKRGQAPAGKSQWNQSMEAEMESFRHELRDVNGYARKGKVCLPARRLLTFSPRGSASRRSRRRLRHFSRRRTLRTSRRTYQARSGSSRR